MSAASLHAGMEYYHRNESRGSRVKYSSPSNSDDASSLLANPSALPFSLCPSLAWGPTNAKPNSRSTITWNRARRKEKRRKNNLKFCPPQATPAPHRDTKNLILAETIHAPTRTHTLLHRSFLFSFFFFVSKLPAQSAQVSRFLTTLSASFPPDAKRTKPNHHLASYFLTLPLKKRTTLVTEAFPCWVLLYIK